MMIEPGSGSPAPERSAHSRRARTSVRRRWFLNHLIAYFGVMVLLVPINFLASPDTPWFLLPLVGWGAPLALHAGFVMGLFDRGDR